MIHHLLSNIAAAAALLRRQPSLEDRLIVAIKTLEEASMLLEALKNRTDELVASHANNGLGGYRTLPEMNEITKGELLARIVASTKIIKAFMTVHDLVCFKGKTTMMRMELDDFLFPETTTPKKEHFDA